MTFGSQAIAQAEEIERLRAALKEAREALEPFAGKFEQRRNKYIRRYRDHEIGRNNFDKMPDRWLMDSCVFNMGDFRRACTTLAKLKGLTHD